MLRKELIVETESNEYAITELGKTLLVQFKGITLIEKAVEQKIMKEIVPASLAQPAKPLKGNIAQNIATIHQDLQDKLHSLIRKNNVTTAFNMPFIPSTTDMQEHLLKFRKKYGKLWNLERIRKCLLIYVESCVRNDKYNPIIKYYIFKESGSFLADALETFSEVDLEDNQFNIKNTKDLFE